MKYNINNKPLSQLIEIDYKLPYFYKAQSRAISSFKRLLTYLSLLIQPMLISGYLYFNTCPLLLACCSSLLVHLLVSSECSTIKLHNMNESMCCNVHQMTLMELVNVNHEKIASHAAPLSTKNSSRPCPSCLFCYQLFCQLSFLKSCLELLFRY